MNYCNGVLDLIGKTPILKLSRYSLRYKLKGNIFAKLEGFNPMGSIKDRVALEMIERAEQSGKLKKGGTIVEPTSGNTGIGLAGVGKNKGYHVIIVMPESMSEERKLLLKIYGAEVILTPAKEGILGSIKVAKDISQKRGAFMPFQFENEANPIVHEKTTGPEIFEALDGNVDCVVCGVGTGGTLTGIGRYLKSKNSNIKIVAVEPEGSAVLSGEKPGKHAIQGIGAGFVPKVFDFSVCDRIIKISDNDAFSTVCELSDIEGIFVGISSGAAVCAARILAENENLNVVAVCPDGGEKYMSLLIN